MKHYYSISAFATTSKQYEDPMIFIEPGMNAFCVLTDDVDILLELLKLDGLRIQEVTQLDGESVQSLGENSGPKSPGRLVPISE